MATLAVKKHIPLPHVIHYKGKDYTFSPVCEDLPDEYRAACLKNSPHIYFDPEGKEVTSDGYQFTDAFKNKSIAEVANHLSDENKLKVLSFAKALAKGEKVLVVEESATTPDVTGVKDGGVDPATLQQLSIPKLEALALLNDIEIPKNAKKKDEIIAFLVEQFNKPQETPAGPPADAPAQ